MAMTDEEFNDYQQPTIDLAEQLTERAKTILTEEGDEAALMAMERIVTFDVTPAQQIKMLALAITIVARMELEG